MRHALTALATTAALWASAATAAALPADLVEAAKAFDRAQAASDRAELERLIADDYVLHNSSGQVQDKKGFIADQTAPGFKMEPFTVEEPVESIHGDTALMGGVSTVRGVSGGQAFTVRLRFMDVWVKRDGEWRVLFAQTTRVPAS
jgi:ketosteroid isomerase-like protein